MTLTNEDLKTLRHPFKPNEHEFLKGNAYITEAAIMTRLEEVDPSMEFYVMNQVQRGDVITVYGRMIVKGVIRESSGMAKVEMTTDGKREANEAEKSATTDALKRCARLFGVGRYLLSLPDDVRDTASIARYLGQVPTSAPKAPTPSPQNGKQNAPDTFANRDVAKAFHTYWKSQSLTDQDMLDALGVTKLSEYPYNRAKADEAVKAFIDRRLQITEHPGRDLHEDVHERA